MFELGNVQNQGYNQYPDYTKQNRITNPHKTINTQQGSQNTNNILLSENSLKDSATDFREKVTAFRLLADEIINSSSMSRYFTKNLQAYVEDIFKATDNSKHTIYTDVGEVLKKIRDEIQAINSSEKSINDVNNKTVESTNYAEFSLSQSVQVEHKIAEQNEISELAGFSSSRIKLETQKALQSQSNIDPNKALKLLIS